MEKDQQCGNDRAVFDEGVDYLLYSLNRFVFR